MGMTRDRHQNSSQGRRKAPPSFRKRDDAVIARSRQTAAPRRSFRHPLSIVAILGLSLWAWSNLFVHVRDLESANTYPSFAMAAEPLLLKAAPGEVVRGRVRNGQSMYNLLARHGLNKGDVLEIVRAAKPLKDLARVRAGQPYRVKLDEQGHFRTFEVDIAGDRMLAVTQTPFGFVAEENEIDFETRLRVLSGTAKSHMFTDLKRVKGASDLVQSLQDIFAWEVDFKKDIRTGDSFRVLVEEIWRDGQFDHFGGVRFAQLTTRDGTVEALRYKGKYYDPSGRALQRSLLPRPVNYRYISSRFSYARRHPLYGRVRPHYGVDFVAAYGTPIRAAGDGIVNFAGWKGDNGRMISIRHKGAYRTVYAHMSRIAPGLKRGVHVQQGEIIGYVGNSGASTGTHLHYGVYKHGRPVNPLKLDFNPIAKPLDLLTNPDFMLAWDQARLTVTRHETPSVRLARLAM